MSALLAMGQPARQSPARAFYIGKQNGSRQTQIIQKIKAVSSNSCYIEERKAPRQNAGWYLTPSPDNPRVLFRAGSLPPLLCSANWGFYALWLTMVTSAPPVPLENTTKKPVLKPHGAAVCGDGLLLDTSITAMTVPVASRPS